jgi:hypothetical protein
MCDVGICKYVLHLQVQSASAVRHVRHVNGAVPCVIQPTSLHCLCTNHPASSVVAAAELPAGSAGSSSGGASVFLAAVNVSSLTGITPCPDSHYCPGGSPIGAGVPQTCPAGITVQMPPGTSRSACNRKYAIHVQRH